MDDGTFPSDTLPSWLVAMGTTTVPTDGKLLPCDTDVWSTFCSWVGFASGTIGKVMVVDVVVGFNELTWTACVCGATLWSCIGCDRTCLLINN